MALPAAQCFRPCGDGIDLSVRLTPKASCDRLDGIETTADGRCHVKARVRAVPEKGSANAALEKLVAKALGIASSSVVVRAGATARLKTLHIAGDPTVLAKAIAALQ